MENYKYTLLIVVAVVMFVSTSSVTATTSASNLPARSSLLGAMLHPQAGQVMRKRSLCNTFGGCGAKRSLASFSGMDEMIDEKRPVGMDSYQSSAKMIDEIIEDIIDHLKKDQNIITNTNNNDNRFVDRYYLITPKQQIDQSNQ